MNNPAILSSLDTSSYYGRPQSATSASPDPVDRQPREEVSLSKAGRKEMERAPEANQTEAYPELAICPDCGLNNCGCVARLEIQKRLDENRMIQRPETALNSQLMMA